MFSKSTVKYIQSLQHKKFRDEYNTFIAEGPKVVDGLLATGSFRVNGIYATQQWVDEIDENLRKRCQDKVTVIKEFELEKIASYTTANKVVAVFEKRVVSENISLKNKITLVLDDIQDPGNMGTIIRTADWFGIENIICSINTVDTYNNKVVQSTMASLGNVNVMYVSLKDWLPQQKQIQIFAATLHGRSIYEYKEMNEAIVIIGNESKGVSEELMELVNEQVTIPRIGQAESLNVAVATGIILSKFTMKG